MFVKMLNRLSVCTSLICWSWHVLGAAFFLISNMSGCTGKQDDKLVACLTSSIHFGNCKVVIKPFWNIAISFLNASPVLMIIIICCRRLDMPPKARKQSKTPSKVSNSECFESPQTPSAPHTPDTEASEKEFVDYLEEASRKYPFLIGKSAFIGQATDARHDSEGFKIWLSEPSMNSSSFKTGSIVSVITSFNVIFKWLL